MVVGDSGEYVIMYCRVQYEYTHSALEDVSIYAVVRLVFPTLHASAVDVRRKSELFVARWSDLDPIAVGQRGSEVDYG